MTRSTPGLCGSGCAGLKWRFMRAAFALLLSGLCALLCLNIGFARLLLTSISELASEAIIVFLGLGIAVRATVDKVRLVRWRLGI